MNFDVAVLLLLASMRFHVHSMKGKQIETCTEVNCRLPWKEANWRFERKEAEAAGTSIAVPDASNELCWHPLLAYMHSCVYVRYFPQTSMEYVVLRLVNMQTYRV